MIRYKNILIAFLAFESAFPGAASGDNYLIKAQNNDAEAQFVLACRYSAGFNAEGERLGRDAKKSMFWLEQSAFNGFQNAQLLLAKRYEKGELVAKNEIIALAWYMVALPSWADFKPAKLLKSKMSAHDFEVAKSYSQSFRKKIGENKKLAAKRSKEEEASDLNATSCDIMRREKKTDLNWFMTHLILGDINLDKYKGKLFEYSRYPRLFETEARILKNSPVELQNAKALRVESGSAIVVQSYDFMGAVLCVIVDSGLGRSGYFFLNSKRPYKIFDFVQNGIFKLAESTLPMDDGGEACIFVEQ